jgi:hypothetical protein
MFRWLVLVRRIAGVLTDSLPDNFAKPEQIPLSIP